MKLPPARMLGFAPAAYIALYAVLLLARPGSPATFNALNNIGGMLPPLAAGVIAIFASRASHDKARLGWLLIGLGCLAWGAGEAIWTWYEVVLKQESPFPSWADAAYLGAVPLLFAGILTLSAPSSTATRIRLGLDALAVVAAAGALNWYFVLDPIYAESEADAMEKLLASAYPLSDLALLFALVVSLPRLLRDDAGRILGIFGAGLVLFLTADTGFAYLETTDSYSTGSIVDIGWVAATCCFAWAALMQYRLRADYRDNRPQTLPGISWFQVLPILLLPVMVGWPLVLDAVDQPLGSTDLPTLGFIYAFAVFVVLRQAVSLIDGVTLNQRLAMSNASLEVRTEVLSERLMKEQTAANKDFLTGVLSRRAIDAELERLTRAAESTVAVGFIDLDSLKAINDRDGHTAGDHVLRLVATALTIDGAIVGRYGGDEFLVLLPEAHEAEVLAYLSIVDWRLGNLAARDDLPTPGISSGFALYPRQASTPGRVLELADQRMYQSKQEKRLQRGFSDEGFNDTQKAA